MFAAPLGSELICVDDRSTDRSREILAQLQAQRPRIRILPQPKNMSKGAALHRGSQEPGGDFVIMRPGIAVRCELRMPAIRELSLQVRPPKLSLASISNARYYEGTGNRRLPKASMQHA